MGIRNVGIARDCPQFFGYPLLSQERLTLFDIISSAVLQMLKVKAYTSLIRPHLEFASAAWDFYTARDINQLSWIKYTIALLF